MAAGPAASAAVGPTFWRAFATVKVRLGATGTSAAVLAVSLSLVAVRIWNVTLNVTFDEAFNGTEKRITVRIPGKSESDTHTVKVPAGAVDGGRVRLKGQGAPGENGGAAGDLLITTKIDAHPYFGRDKADVTVDLPINVAEAALGASIVVPTPDGKKIKVKVPAGTQDGKVLTIKGKGAPDLKNKGQFGNLKIQIHVEVPTDMNDEQKKAMEDFLAATGEEKRPWA